MQSAWARPAVGWATLALLLALGLGGAAATPEGVLLGAPGLGALVCVAVALVALAAVAGREAAQPSLGFLPLPLLLLAGVLLPCVRAWSGPPLLAVALAGFVLALAQARVPVARVLFLPVVLAVYCGVAARVQAQVGAEGDEPHYLMVADSLLRDHDLDLTQDYAEGRYRAFHAGDLAPHYRVRGAGGEIYSLHALGLSLLVLPAYAAGGYPAASFFMALLAALVACEIRGLLREAWGDQAGTVADGVAWLVALSPPLIHYAGLVFTEVPAAFVVALVLRRGRGLGRSGTGTALGLGVAIAFLPWLNVRYALVAAVLALYALMGRPGRRAAAALVVPSLASAVGLALYHHALYGFYDPRRVYGARPELSLGNLPEALPGLFFDQEFGLFVYAPAFVLAFPGLVRLARERRRLAVAGAVLVVLVVATAASWPMWRGGFNPPARFLVPLVPVFALGLAAWLRRGVGAGAALLLGWGLWTGLAGGAEPRLVHRDRDGGAPLLRERSGALEWTGLLPGYVLADADRRRLTLVWAVALAAAVVSRRRGSAAVAVATLGLLAAAAAAARGSGAGGAEARDAVRVIGRPALAVPGWRWTDPSPGRWTAAAVDWGPLYEPHRHPDGATLGARLALPPGAYVIDVQADALGASGPPQLEVRPEPEGTVRVQWLDPGPPGSWRTGFDVLPGERAVTLAIRGGGPLMLRGFNLLPAARSNPLTGGVTR